MAGRLGYPDLAITAHAFASLNLRLPTCSPCRVISDDDDEGEAAGPGRAGAKQGTLDAFLSSRLQSSAGGVSSRALAREITGVLSGRLAACWRGA